MNKVIVEPIEKQTSGETEEIVKKRIDIMKLGVGVNKIDKGPKGSIILNIPRKEDQATLRDELKKNLGEKYKVPKCQNINYQK